MEEMKNMSVENENILTTIAEQKDDERQEAEAKEAQELLEQLRKEEEEKAQAEEKARKEQEEEDAKRRAHEETEAQRKREWERKKLEKEEAEQAAWENAVAMDDDSVMKASMKRVGDDAERITRRNMKQCVTEHIQTKCLDDASFARQAMHPRKTMINCFRYINRKAKEFVEREMKDNDEKPTNGVYGCDVPDDLCYQWAETYFWDLDAEEDKEKEEKFVPRPYTGKSAPKTKKKAEKKKPISKPEPKTETKPEQKSEEGEQMSLFEVSA